MLEILAENEKAFSMIDEDGNISIHLHEGMPEDTFLTGREAYDLFLETIKAYQIKVALKLFKYSTSKTIVASTSLTEITSFGV